MSRWASIEAGFARHWRWALILSFLVLLPSETLFNVPIGIMAIAGLVIIVRRFEEVRRDPVMRRLALLFLCIWLPMLLALPDAWNLSHSALTTLKYFRFPFVGVFVLMALREEHARRYLFIGILCVLVAWCLDALFQFAYGENVLGYPDYGKRLVGIFYPKYRLGIVLAALAPLYFELLRKLVQPRWLAWVLAIPFVAVITASGSRAAWIMLAVALPGYVAFLYFQVGPRILKTSAAVKAVLVLTLTAAAAAQYPGLSARLDQATGIFSGEFEVMDLATKRRLSIWLPALELAKAHWLNGIGPRGFRYAFLETAGEENFWMKRDPPGVTHPHQMFLEIATESGAAGVVGLAAFFLIGVRMLREAGHRSLLVPCALCVLVAMLPLNVHMAFYSSFWSSICWWLIFLFIAVHGARSGPDPTSSRREA